MWNEEKEWRIFGTPNTSLKYEPSALTAIYFGFDTEASDIKTVFEYTKHIPGLKYYRPLLLRDKYEIDFDSVTEENLVDE